MARNLYITRRDFVRAAETSFSGGVWTLPLSNMQEHNIDYPAEAADSATTTTLFVCDLGVHRNIGLFYFQNLRLTVNATVRLRAGLAADFSTTAYDTGTIAGWPADEPAAYNPWGEFSLTGAYNSDEYVGIGMPRYFVPPAPVLVRYIKFEVSDRTATEPLRIGVFGAAEIWQPPRNFLYDRKVTVIDDSEVMRVPGGAAFIQRRRVRQRHSYGLGFIPDGSRGEYDEMWRRAIDLALLKGQSDPIVVVPNPDDATNLERQAIYGLVSTAPEFTNPLFGLWSMTFQIDQL